MMTANLVRLLAIILSSSNPSCYHPFSNNLWFELFVCYFSLLFCYYFPNCMRWLYWTILFFCHLLISLLSWFVSFVVGYSLAGAVIHNQWTTNHKKTKRDIKYISKTNGTAIWINAIKCLDWIVTSENVTHQHTYIVI